MGCHRCCECDGKFEGYDAQEYAECECEDCGGESEGQCEVNYDVCPSCLDKRAGEAAKNAALDSLRARVAALEGEVKAERSKRVAAEARAAASACVDLTADSSEDDAPKVGRFRKYCYQLRRLLPSTGLNRFEPF